MKSFKDMMKYKPPHFSVFQKFGSGYLFEASWAIMRAESDLVHSRWKLLEDPNWGEAPEVVPEEDLVEMYAYWTMADDMLKRLDRMEPEECEKHCALDMGGRNAGGTFSLEEASLKHADIDGRITAWEASEGKEKVYPALDRQLKRRLDTWEHGISRIEAHDFLDDDEPFQGIGDFCYERTIIEYAAMGIENLQFRYPDRMRPLPYLHTFLVRRLKLDERFRKVLRGRYQYAPWTERDFWWCYPPSKAQSRK
jgi:hypothetical protein